jgi:hypothetical protein
MVHRRSGGIRSALRTFRCFAQHVPIASPLPVVDFNALAISAASLMQVPRKRHSVVVLRRKIKLHVNFCANKIQDDNKIVKKYKTVAALDPSLCNVTLVSAVVLVSRASPRASVERTVPAARHCLCAALIARDGQSPAIPAAVRVAAGEQAAPAVPRGPLHAAHALVLEEAPPDAAHEERGALCRKETWKGGKRRVSGRRASE